jgi:hypothetical protein
MAIVIVCAVTACKTSREDSRPAPIDAAAAVTDARVAIPDLVPPAPPPGPSLTEVLGGDRDLSADLERGEHGVPGLGPSRDGHRRVGVAEDEPAAPRGALVVEIEGAAALDDHPVDAVVDRLRARYHAAVRRCYQAALKQDPLLTGRGTVLFTVDERGAVADAEVEAPAALDVCLTAEARRWRFPIVTDDAGAPTSVRFRVVYVFGSPPASR